MTTPYEAVKEYVTTSEWGFEENEENKVLSMTINGKNSQFRCYIMINEDDNLLQCITVYPTKAQDNQMQVLTELICRANSGMQIGKFEVDFSDREIRFFASSSFMTGVLPEEVINKVFCVGFVTADRYYPTFMKVMFGNTSPEDAIIEIEGMSEEE